ncbi:hypothetical protein FEM48_Zijuj08G0148100 [Ziziphus jujuba var. spinosa]|uniref:Uncharacterized protein n=1 Tax=Ziziphus jujuba var. spinosa TaxID=714518 RepID=A0A978UZR2_ZIZJJ|nr:hypothetical protein FEM48_Zijuj08G0148100 [Ziziphus jujuba var. spinosa]
MTRENAMQIGGLFPEVLKCETTSHTNAIGIKYMRLQVEVDTSSPVPTGFLHKGHGKSLCPNQQSGQQAKDQEPKGNLFGPWLRAEVHASLGVKENMFPRWTEGSQEQAPDNTEAKNKDETESTQLSQEPSEKDGMAQEAGNGPKQSPMSKQHVDNTPCHTDLTENSNITTNQSLLSGGKRKREDRVLQVKAQSKSNNK